eukprot:CAMPEP_0202868426 /NCGR_PEP_ID=MMETSP1391-20130828/10874_1 /ASSEMBLY_ACC=CAM_ASM_000867 /TAXON_ID=1034604 /ORGANISM="Chlamydomonas leiostraca, Strain SAG 11-49" /LENGTH=234 /DNA_ID=CAMNT_0049548599 /DNA_START=244 /DNA_END=948 /DNA_ORIENTATION=+
MQPSRHARSSGGIPQALTGSGGGGPLSKPGHQKGQDVGNGVYMLMLANAAIFLADHVLHLPFMQSLYLYHAHPAWWQWVTHMFSHANWGHLSNNLFFLLTFGRLVEETEGFWGVMAVYIICGLGAAAASVLLSPANTVSVGASGAVFGMFAFSVLSRLTSLNLRRLLESIVLGQFVVRQVLEEVAAQVGGGKVMAGGLAVSHLAHLGGALAGVLLVLALGMLPGAGDDSKAGSA